MIYSEYIKSKKWKELRRKAYKRSSNKCEFCEKKAYAVHHVKYPKRFEEDNLDNLIVVCKKCHELNHGIRDEERLRNEINKRLSTEKTYDNEGIEQSDYVGFNMSGGGMGLGRLLGDYPSFLEQEVNRLNNFILFMGKFYDYMPPKFASEHFKLNCWKGRVGWEEKEFGEQEYDFTGKTTEDICFWIIKNFGKEKEENEYTTH